MRIAPHTTLSIAVGLTLGTAVASATAQEQEQQRLQLQFQQETRLSQPADPPAAGLPLGTGANKTKLFRHRDGTLVAVYGDFVSAPPEADDHNPFLVYDLKGQKERPPRDQFVRTCRPGDQRGDGSEKTCNVETDWSAPVNISDSATRSSIAADWRGDGDLRTYWGDAEKPNGFVNPDGITVVSWVSHYCPDGDPATPGVQDPVQRARMYIERNFRTIPFTCTWVAHSTDSGQTWEAPVQLSSGERAAKQDVNRATQSGWAVTWQEDPTGLELGQGLGPGDGASGANISGGTDVWYSRVTSRPPEGPWAWAEPVRLTDNFEGKSGTPGSLAIIYDGNGNPVDDDDIEKGRAGAARPNLGAIGNNLIVAWEETKGSEGLDEGKFIRYLSFPYNAPLQQDLVLPDGTVKIGTPGCIISDPAKNARRVRFVTQGSTEAGLNGIQIGIFWKEGVTSQGGPSDIMLRRWIWQGDAAHSTNGFRIENFEPSVDTNCATSVYAETQALQHEPAENLSSRTKEVAATGVDNLGDDTELQFTENALAHRGLLRGRDLWVGYNYTENLALLTYLNLDNYNFWIRRYSVDSGTWNRPKQVSDITDTGINLREPRLVGTPAGDAAACTAGDLSECRNTDVFFVAWGSQTNVSPWAPEDAEDLGLWITRTTDAGETFEPVVQLSDAQGVFGGSLPEDEEGERAFESQLQARPDGKQIFGVWNQVVSESETHAVFNSGEPVEIPLTPARRSSGGGCAYNPNSAMDWMLPGLLAVALLALGWRRRMSRR